MTNAICKILIYMKISKNFDKISPEEFAKARDSVRIAVPKKIMKPLEFRKL